MNFLKENWQTFAIDALALIFIILFFATNHVVLATALIILTVIGNVLYFLGMKAQSRQEEQQAQIDAAKQTVSMFIISKKKMKMSEAGLPAAAIESVPKLMRRQKLPILKVKVGPQILNLICDAQIFDSVPEKKEVKATVSGLYVTSVKGLHGKKGAVKEEKKKGFFKRAIEKAQEKAGTKQVK